MSALEVQAWAPACMAEDEYQAWAEMNRRVYMKQTGSSRPCVDCTLGYASEMRAVGRCNGTPDGVEEEEDVEQPEPVDVRLNRRVPVNVTPPPCASCAHEPVCALRATVEGLVEIPVAAPPVPAGLRIQLVATVECEHFLRDKAKPAPVRVLTSQQRGQANSVGVGGRKPHTPETKERLRQLALARAAEKRAGGAA